MNRSSLSHFVSIALAGAALVACSSDFSGAPSEEGVAQTTQGLKKCAPDCEGPADPPAPKNPKPPATTTGTTTPPPPPPPPYTPPTFPIGDLPVLQETDYTFTCNDVNHQISNWTQGPGGTRIWDEANPVCWDITDCHIVMARMVSSSSSSGSPPPQGPICSGYTLVSQSYCSYGLHMSCDPLYGTCRCRP